MQTRGAQNTQKFPNVAKLQVPKKYPKMSPKVSKNVHKVPKHVPKYAKFAGPLAQGVLDSWLQSFSQSNPPRRFTSPPSAGEPWSRIHDYSEVGVHSWDDFFYVFSHFFPGSIFGQVFYRFWRHFHAIWLPKCRKITPQIPQINHFTLESLIFPDFHVFFKKSQKWAPKRPKLPPRAPKVSPRAPKMSPKSP